MTTIVAVRHGETTWNRKQRLQGWAPSPLTDIGQEQAGQLGATLTEGYDIDRVLSSDLYRAEETVDILLEHFDAPVAFESAWRERDIGVYRGLQFDEMSERFPEHDLGETGPEAAHRRAESGESLVDVHDRVIKRWETILAECESRERERDPPHRDAWWPHSTASWTPERYRYRRIDHGTVTGVLLDKRVRVRPQYR